MIFLAFREVLASIGCTRRGIWVSRLYFKKQVVYQTITCVLKPHEKVSICLMKESCEIGGLFDILNALIQVFEVPENITFAQEKQLFLPTCAAL